MVVCYAWMLLLIIKLWAFNYWNISSLIPRYTRLLKECRSNYNFKNGDVIDIGNYWPRKVFSKILTNRLISKFDFYQPIEQYGLWKSSLTIYHLLCIRSFIEKTTEYNIPIWHILKSMNNARIDSRYISQSSKTRMLFYT